MNLRTICYFTFPMKSIRFILFNCDCQEESSESVNKNQYLMKIIYFFDHCTGFHLFLSIQFQEHQTSWWDIRQNSEANGAIAEVPPRFRGAVRQVPVKRQN